MKIIDLGRPVTTCTVGYLSDSWTSRCNVRCFVVRVGTRLAPAIGVADCLAVTYGLQYKSRY